MYVQLTEVLLSHQQVSVRQLLQSLEVGDVVGLRDEVHAALVALRHAGVDEVCVASCADGLWSHHRFHLQARELMLHVAECF